MMIGVARNELPTGIVTFVFTDIEGSTDRLHAVGDAAYAAELADHRRIVRDVISRQGGVEVDTQGDSFFFAFTSAASAVAAASDVTAELAGNPLQARIGLHTGEALLTADGYVGEAIHVAARVAAAAHGGQVVLTEATVGLIKAPVSSLGEHRFAGIPDPIAIYQLGETGFPPLRSASVTNVPRPATSFIGRTRELDALRRQIEDGVRLVTLIGSGGTGKSRLAVELATALRDRFGAGVFWVALASIRDPAVVGDAIAQAIGTKASPAEHIGNRHVCAVLDNFEQVIDAATTVADLLARCPNLVLIVTSRERLRISAEVDHEVGPLHDNDAITLYCTRARVQPSLEISELCRRLDNLPLAIELAAGHKVLSTGQILERLGQRLDLLKGGRDADPRQQTLRATLEWSDELLTPSEHQLFARLSVFADSCTLAAAEDVCEAQIDTLESLVEKSLVRRSGERYGMLETIRVYAREQLDPEEAAVVERHLTDNVMANAETISDRLFTADEAATSANLFPDYANVRAAIEYALAAGAPGKVARILGSLYPFLITHGNLVEVWEWCDSALNERERLSRNELANLLAGASEIARFAGDFPRAISLKQELLTIDLPLKRPGWRAATLADLCEIALAEGDLERAKVYADQCLAAGGGPRAVLCMAELALRHGQFASATRYGREALDGFDEGSFNHACALELLAETARRAGDLDAAYDHFNQALRSFATLGDPGGIADCLDGLARLAADDADGERAGRLAGAASHLRSSRGRRTTRNDLEPLAVSEEARQQGSALQTEQVIDQALRAVAFRILERNPRPKT